MAPNDQELEGPGARAFVNVLCLFLERAHPREVSHALAKPQRVTTLDP